MPPAVACTTRIRVLQGFTVSKVCRICIADQVDPINFAFCGNTETARPNFCTAASGKLPQSSGRMNLGATSMPTTLTR